MSNPPRAKSGVIDRLRGSLGEVGRFGLVGGLGYITDVGSFNLLRFAGSPGLLEHKPLTAKVISVTLATVVTYFGNRFFTWRERKQARGPRQYVTFIGLNLIGMAISLVCLAVSHYLLNLTSPLADNISANGVGLVLGTTFRFWSYQRWVFPPASDGPEPISEPAGSSAAGR